MQYKILVIDDSIEDREACIRALRKVVGTAYQVAECTGGDEGIAYIGNHPQDCVLLDYYMPGRDGMETLKHIRAKYPFLPVIILTGQEDPSVPAEIIRYGAQSYLSKYDINAENLGEAVRLAIEHCALKRRG